MSAGLRVLETRDPQGLTFSDVTDSLKDLREQKQKEADTRATQRLTDIEAVNNDLKVPFFRDAISDLTNQYVGYVESPEYNAPKAGAMRQTIFNAIGNLREIDNNIAAKMTSNPDSFGIYQDEIFGMYDGTSILPKDPSAIQFANNALAYANTEKKDAVTYRSDIASQVDNLLASKAKQQGRQYTVGEKPYQVMVSSLTEDEKRQLAQEAAMDKGYVKYLQDDVFGRRISQKEAADKAYEQFFSILPTEDRETKAGNVPKDDKYGWSGDKYSNKRYRLSPIDLDSPEAIKKLGSAFDGEEDYSRVIGYDVTRQVGGDPDVAQFFTEYGKTIVGRPNSVISVGGNEYINVLYKGKEDEVVDGQRTGETVSVQKISRLPLNDANRSRLFNYLDIDENIHQRFIKGQSGRMESGGKGASGGSTNETLIKGFSDEEVIEAAKQSNMTVEEYVDAYNKQK